MHIIPFIILIAPIVVVMRNAYKWANQWDTDTCAIKGMIRNTPAPTTVTVINPMVAEYAAIHNRTLAMLEMGIMPDFMRSDWMYPMEDMVDTCIPDPQPFNWDSKLHMMLPDDFYALIMATEDDLTYTNKEGH